MAERRILKSARSKVPSIRPDLSMTGICGAIPRFSTNQSSFNTLSNDRFEHIPQHITVTKATMPIFEESRMIRDRVVQIKLAKQSIGQVQMNFITQSPLGPSHQKQQYTLLTTVFLEKPVALMSDYFQPFNPYKYYKKEKKRAA